MFTGRPLLLVCAAAVLVAALPTQGPPTLEILQPTDGASLRGPDVVVRVRLRGEDLEEGRFVLLTLDSLPPVKSFAERFTFRGVKPGAHLLTAELRHADGRGYDPPVRARVRFEIRGRSGV